MPELIACPQCGRQLSVQDALLGQQVRCPACQTVFTAEPRAGASAPPPPREDAPRERPQGRRYEEEERRPARRYEEEDRPRRDYDEEDEDRSRGRRRPSPEAIRQAASNKIAAGVCGILLGWLGVHKFILGLTGPGIIMLLITVLTCFIASPVTSIIGIIEGIIYLTKSDEDFYRDYVVDKKGWF